MKKALTVFLMLALVGSVFAAEPVADVAPFLLLNQLQM